MSEISPDIELTKQLLEALFQGKQIVKIHNDDPECEELLGFDHIFYVGGWASAFGRAEDRVLELVTNPKRWSIKHA